MLNILARFLFCGCGYEVYCETYLHTCPIMDRFVTYRNVAVHTLYIADQKKIVS